jgi:hypothetical protein
METSPTNAVDLKQHTMIADLFGPGLTSAEDFGTQ